MERRSIGCRSNARGAKRQLRSGLMPTDARRFPGETRLGAFSPKAAPPGCGETRVACDAIRRRSRATLIPSYLRRDSCGRTAKLEFSRSDALDNGADAGIPAKTSTTSSSYLESLWLRKRKPGQHKRRVAPRVSGDRAKNAKRRPPRGGFLRAACAKLPRCALSR